MSRKLTRSLAPETMRLCCHKSAPARDGYSKNIYKSAAKPSVSFMLGLRTFQEDTKYIPPEQWWYSADYYSTTRILKWIKTAWVKFRSTNSNISIRPLVLTLVVVQALGTYQQGRETKTKQATRKSTSPIQIQQHKSPIKDFLSHTTIGNWILLLPCDPSKLTVPRSGIFGGVASRILFTEITTLSQRPPTSTAPNNH